MLKLVPWIILQCVFLPSFLAGIDSFSTYERAEFYHNNSQQQWSVAFEALNSYPFKGNESVIEIGCRSGRVAANLAGRIPKGQVIATEMRGQGAIEFAKKNYSHQLYPNLTFLDQDFVKTTYTDKFDLAIAFSSMHWYKNQDEILKRVYQALKPGGRILFTIPGKPLPSLNASLELVDMDEWKSYFKGYVHPRMKISPEEYQAFLEKAGFKSIEITVNRRQYYFENKRALMDWFKAFTPYLDPIPDAKKESFLTDFANLYTQYFPIGPDGRIPFVQDELFVRAIK